MSNTFKDTFISASHKYSVGEAFPSGRKFLSFLTTSTNRTVDYEV